MSSINGTKPTVLFNFGSNINIKNVFMGCDGDDMFDSSEKYRKAYEDLNSLHLEDEIDWLNNPANHGITLQYLPVPHKDRPRIYEHLLDLCGIFYRVRHDPREAGPGTEEDIGPPGNLHQT